MTDFLRTILPERLINTYGMIKWPPRSPDFAPNNLFFGVFLKNKSIDINGKELMN